MDRNQNRLSAARALMRRAFVLTPARPQPVGPSAPPAAEGFPPPFFRYDPTRTRLVPMVTGCWADAEFDAYRAPVHLGDRLVRWWDPGLPKAERMAAASIVRRERDATLRAAFGQRVFRAPRPGWVWFHDLLRDRPSMAADLLAELREARMSFEAFWRVTHP